ncbi:MAG: response regulator transcription factor [Flavobacteriales bacterium]
MTTNIRIGIAINNLLVREGICSIFRKTPGYEIVYTVDTPTELIEKQKENNDDLVIVDFYSYGFDKQLVYELCKNREGRPVMALTSYTVAEDARWLREQGLKGYLLHDCSEDEFFDAIRFLNAGEQFYCGKVVDAIIHHAEKPDSMHEPTPSCEGLNISDRELQIISYIAEGKSNKEIAELLFISPLTVKTHRKNIMNKLGVNNTAGIVRFALGENGALQQ